MKEATITKQDTGDKNTSLKGNTHIKSLIEKLLTSMNITFDGVEALENSLSNKKTFAIKTKESGLLIGEDGETLYALTHILRRMAHKESEEISDFSIDINDYKSSMVERLKSKANELADKVRLMRLSMEMEPMSSYERLIVHDALSNKPNIKTESIGEGKERRVVIKYIDLDLS